MWRFQPPTFTITALADQNIAENTAYTSAIPSITGTFAGTLTWSLGGDDAEHFSIDSTTGTVTLTERDYEAPTDNGEDNTYRFTLIATDTDNSIITSAVTTITITDANVIGAGLTLTPTSLTVDEGSMTHTYTVVLDAVPAGPDPVIVDINQNGEVTTSPVTLSFTTATWNTAQTVTLTAVEDDDAITEDITLMHTTSGDDYDVTATLTVTVTDNDPRFDTTIADQVYLAGATITTLTLPSAIGGTGMLTYTLMPSASIPVGLTFINNAAARTLTGRPTTASATTPLIYTVIDSAASPLPATLTFSVTVVAVTVPDGGKAEADETGKTIAVDYVGDGDNDLLLTLPTLTGATTFTVGTYDPIAEGTPAPAGVAFSRTANIDTSGTPAADTTVCLSTIGVPEGSDPVLYHYTTAFGQLVETWNKIGSNLVTRGDLDFVCGPTTIFSPFAVGYDDPTVVLGTNTTTRLNEQILTRASQAMTAGTLEAVARRVEAAAGGAASSAGDTGSTPALAYQFGGQSSLSGLLKSHGKAMLEDQMEYEQLFNGASFVVPLSAAEGGTGGGKSGGGALSLWGSSNFINLDSDNDGLDSDNDWLDWDGQVDQHQCWCGWVDRRENAGRVCAVVESIQF